MKDVTMTHRGLLKAGAASGLVAASGLAAPAIAQDWAIRLGYVSLQSGPLAASPRLTATSSTPSPR